MTRKFTQNLLGVIIFSLGFIMNPVKVNAQACNTPTGLGTSNLSNFSTTLNWTLDSSVDHYRLRYREVGTSSWSFKHNATGTSEDIASLNANMMHIWQAKAFCSAGNSPSSSWSAVDTFITTNYPIDCNNTPNGTAYIDSCGNCVGGTTGDVACIPFSPTVSVSLSNTNCDSLSDLTINVSQDPNEPDMATSLFSSDTGSFAISTLSVGDTVGSAVMSANGGSLNFSAVLIVSSIISINQAIIQSINISTGLSLGTFTISNVSGGISIMAQSITDGNNVTSGNSETATFNNIFINPGASILTFTSAINSELLDVDTQTFPFSIVCVQTCPQLGDANCDGIVNLSDLTLVVNHWLQSTVVGQDGDVVGSLDGFVNLNDLTLVVNNWLQSTP